jgi:hypothetical protein
MDAFSLMKALWAWEKRVFTKGTNLVAINFATIFATAWMRLIGI